MNRLPSDQSRENQGNSDKVLLTGSLMAASPWARDPNFRNSVCLIVEHGEQGAVGVVLNRPMELDPKPLLSFLFEGQEQELVDTAGIPMAHFNFGGPNNGPILAIHNESALAEGGNNHGVYLSAQLPTLRQLAQNSPEHLRWFIGHAVWTKSQLEQQIVDHHWLVVPAVPEIVFEKEETMWERAIEFYGDLVLSEFPGVGKHTQRAACN
ncbi:MAG: YqgE/AlgH family protein [Planctomycetota bacterium]|jgi:putative transcriptional regulator|nr:YqgE/AlgH family protein [Planctomycetota bacterium]